MQHRVCLINDANEIANQDLETERKAVPRSCFIKMRNIEKIADYVLY